MKKRGRPKGVHSSVIGLPIKRNKRKLSNQQVPFKKLSIKEKQFKILAWIFGEQKAEECTSCQYVICDRDVPKHNMMPLLLLDENVDVNLISSYFTRTAFAKLERLLKIKRMKAKWSCSQCKNEADGHIIGCEFCLEWYHLECVNLKKKPKVVDWMCRKCSSNKNNQQGIIFKYLNVYRNEIKIA
jgi:Chromatin remodeling protein, contains PhD zinc finger